ncbi:hypothetical protein A3F28_03580 [Candidatus Uhrbacteria bacterium RIFCSPHIGHO2_12_FULL_57_11]|uniref:Small-conductance mechanosensitive ion channel n=2 Tax=Candidatus Uhriibacteriota TaxID=1752732 RepID=A0A1F7UJ83_9BACT|nr:MAG: hypothetical protein A3D72_01280 [Candidatus Uhrbacteria bacterium RIFCSPHIGHO2_02_FULL_57_19]OGL78341.1 MAG: hypothetical protein A3F28_03580 [Candidatus Uhrbacteria bacterium RIFCSPHIGHO2_12_FULL_57_11]
MSPSVGFLATWSDILTASFQNLWLSVVQFLPRLLGALVVVILGWLVAAALGNLAATVIKFIKIDELADRLDLKKTAKRAGVDLSVSGLIGWLVKWFLILAFFITAVDILGWTQVNVFLNQVVLYLPNVVIAVVILLAGILLGNFVHDLVDASLRTAKLGSADFLAGVAKWSVMVFSAMAALVQLGVASQLIQILFTGLVAMLAISGGLAFGLGGRDHAERFLERVRKDLSE